MQTFESARIQTAARAVGVAQSAMEHALAMPMRGAVSAVDHCVSAGRDKIAMMAVEIMIARQLTYHAAREKDFRAALRSRGGHGEIAGGRVRGRRRQCVADPWRQRFALEFRCRAFSVTLASEHLEGAAEIQAQVIARRLLDGSN